MSFARKRDGCDLNRFFFFFNLNIWKERGFTCHLMALLKEYGNVAFSLQIFSHKIENNYEEDSPRTDNAVLFKNRLPKNANCHSEQRNVYSEFSCVCVV